MDFYYFVKNNIVVKTILFYIDKLRDFIFRPVFMMLRFIGLGVLVNPFDALLSIFSEIKKAVKKVFEIVNDFKGFSICDLIKDADK